EGGYIAFSCSGVNLCVANLVNGTLVGIVSDTPLPVQPPAYANGEFIVSTSATAAQNYLQGYTVTNAGIVKVWQTALSSSATTNPVVNGNEIAVGSGSALYITTLGGVVTNTIALSGSVKGISSANNNIYVQTSAGLYGFNPNGVQIFSHTTPTQNFNFTPSIAGSTLYTLINGRVFEGFNVNNGQQLWNMSLPNAPYAPSGTQFYNNIALAYGNAYVADGSELYAFGTYKAKPGDSLLQSLAAMYLNNQGAYASILLSKIYPSQNVGLYINSTYAPDLQVATFNAISGCASLAYLSTNTTAALQQGKNISVSAWMYPTDLTTSRGVVSGDSYFIRVDSPGEGGKISWFVYVNSAIEPRLSSKAAPQTNRWYHVVGTYNQKSGVMNLYVNGALNNTETRTGAPTTGYFGAGYKFTVGTASSCQFIGKIADVQVYDNALSSGQVQQLYSEGLFGAPLSGSGLALWWPLDGNGNDYGGNFYNGFPNNVLWQNATYLPGSLLNSYQVSKASTPVALPSNGINNFYNVSVVVWK
ncbi:MAG: hypothetical protein KGH58_02625, partial [Candidatus Micrarchaeota archaeon]|nr:hypothetical protein [Candidatus Micrarchaeota archaeon]